MIILNLLVIAILSNLLLQLGITLLDKYLVEVQWLGPRENVVDQMVDIKLILISLLVGVLCLDGHVTVKGC